MQSGLFSRENSVLAEKSLGQDGWTTLGGGIVIRRQRGEQGQNHKTFFKSGVNPGYSGACLWRQSRADV